MHVPRPHIRTLGGRCCCIAIVDPGLHIQAPWGLVLRRGPLQAAAESSGGRWDLSWGFWLPSPQLWETGPKHMFFFGKTASRRLSLTQSLSDE